MNNIEAEVAKIVFNFYCDYFNDYICKNSKIKPASTQWLFSEKHLTPELKLALFRLYNYTYLDYDRFVNGQDIPYFWFIKKVVFFEGYYIVTVEGKWNENKNYHKIAEIKCNKYGNRYLIYDIEHSLKDCNNLSLGFVTNKNGIKAYTTPNSKKIIRIFKYGTVLEYLNNNNDWCFAIDYYSSNKSIKKEYDLDGYVKITDIEKADFTTKIEQNTPIYYVKALFGPPQKETKTELIYTNKDKIIIKDDKVIGFKGFNEFKYLFKHYNSAEN